MSKMPNANMITRMEQQVPMKATTLIACLLNSHKSDWTNTLAKAL